MQLRTLALAVLVRGTLTIGNPAHTLVCFYANRLAIREATGKLTAVAAMCNQSGSSLHLDKIASELLKVPTVWEKLLLIKSNALSETLHELPNPVNDIDYS